MYRTLQNLLILVFLIVASTSFATKTVIEEKKASLPLLDLPQFVHDRTVVLDHITANASGLSWDKKNNRLVAVINNPPEICFLTPEGAADQSVLLTNFSDTEAIAHIADNQFAIVNEKHMNIVLAAIDLKTETINAKDFPHIRVSGKIDKNSGLEGLTYDPATRTFFAVKEKSPKRIYQIHMEKWSESGIAPDFDYKVSSAWGLPYACYWLDDFSGIHLDTNTGHFLILSDDSKTIVEVNSTGKLIRRLSLEQLINGPVPQPEGLVIAPDRRLYILSEPNLLYIFKPQA
jgi:uncharacterized protein YjiK